MEIPEFPKVHGKEAINTLYEYINELQEQSCKELTRKQKAALIKFARGMITSIEAEMQAKDTIKRMKQKSRFVTQLKEAIIKCLPESDQAYENSNLLSMLPNPSILPISTRAVTILGASPERALPKYS